MSPTSYQAAPPRVDKCSICARDRPVNSQSPKISTNAISKKLGYTEVLVVILEFLNSLGRLIEYQLTGQADFRIQLPNTKTRTVETDLEGKLQLNSVRSELLQQFSLSLRWPIMLEVKKPPPLGWKAGFYHSEGNLGRYQAKPLGSQQGHHVTVRPGLRTAVFRAILAHELVHAAQTEGDLLVGNQALREGMARWVEYHFLKNDCPDEAERLRRLRHYTFGKAIETILEYETQNGRQSALKWLRDFENGRELAQTSVG